MWGIQIALNNCYNDICSVWITVPPNLLNKEIRVPNENFISQADYVQGVIWYNNLYDSYLNSLCKPYIRERSYLTYHVMR